MITVVWGSAVINGVLVFFAFFYFINWSSLEIQTRKRLFFDCLLSSVHNEFLPNVWSSFAQSCIILCLDMLNLHYYFLLRKLLAYFMLSYSERFHASVVNVDDRCVSCITWRYQLEVETAYCGEAVSLLIIILLLTGWNFALRRSL